MKYELKEISPDEITIPERFRKDYGDIEELACSIEDRGQLQPIIIDQTYTLIDGYRRILACKSINRLVMSMIKPSESKLEREADELIANIHRKDFTWQEKCLAISKLHESQQQSQRVLADLIGISKSDVSENLILADCIKENEKKFMRFKTKKEATDYRKKMTKVNYAIEKGVGKEEIFNLIIKGDKALKKNGWIYILNNPSLPENLIKIGKTSRTPELRAKELSVPTGIPSEYKIVYKTEVPDCDLVEMIIHKELDNHRHTDNREFFSVPIKKAIKIVEIVIKHINPTTKHNIIYC